MTIDIKKNYVLMSGQGRSGMKWLIGILDQSRQTHCRVEPYACVKSAFARLPSRVVYHPNLDAELAPAWDETIARASRSFGRTDHSIAVYKDHFRKLYQRLGLVRIVRSHRLRRAVNKVRSSPLAEEWPFPSWIESKQQDGLVPIIKINRSPGWLVWALRNRPQAHVLHVVRHPGGFLHSVMDHFWTKTDLKDVARANQKRLLRVVGADPAWGARFGDLEGISPVESEIWYWTYCNELIHQAGAGNPRYNLIKYEELAHHPVETSRAIYRAIGLDFTDSIEQYVRQSSTRSREIAAAWRKELDAQQIEQIERILDASLMRDWWTGFGSA